MNKNVLIIAATFWFLTSYLSSAAKTVNFPAVNRQQDNSTQKSPTPRSTNRKPEAKPKPESLDFSGTGRPGQQTAGENRGSCPRTDTNLTAIVPISHAGKTVAKYPSFWFYFPYNSQSIKKVEFVLQNESRESIVRSPVAIPQHPGYANVSLPLTAPPLAMGKWYRWYIKVYCDRDSNNTPLFVQGWVNRVALDSNLYLKLREKPQQAHLTYGSHNIWYDAVHTVLSRYQSQPHNSSLNRDLRQLTKAKGVDLQLPDLNKARVKN